MRVRTYALLSVVIVCFGAVAFGGIAGTAHDFSAAGWNASGEICLPCHVPHNAQVAGDGSSMVLWNHAITAETFDMYSFSTVRATRDQDSEVLLGSPSKLCLSCHDGVTALDSYGGTTGTTPIGAVPGNLGTDLQDDHPIGIQYPVTDYATFGYKDPTTLTPVKLVDWSATKTNRVECTSCHEPHSDAYDKFLRMDNAGSALCLKCHDK